MEQRIKCLDKDILLISILVDQVDAWIMPYVTNLVDQLQQHNHKVNLCRDKSKICSGDIAIYLSCTNIVPNNILSLNKHNIVVHECALPKGKGWSPLSWQILEGYNEVPITVFEASDEVDGGVVYLQDEMHFRGDELVEELRKVQGDKTVELVMKFIALYPDIKSEEQSGEETYYEKRTPVDSELDINKTLIEQFNKLRVVDNIRYPAYFIYKGFKYIYC